MECSDFRLRRYVDSKKTNNVPSVACRESGVAGNRVEVELLTTVVVDVIVVVVSMGGIEINLQFSETILL